MNFSVGGAGREQLVCFRVLKRAGIRREIAGCIGGVSLYTVFLRIAAHSAGDGAVAGAQGQLISRDVVQNQRGVAGNQIELPGLAGAGGNAAVACGCGEREGLGVR